ncbi:C-terminal binding protein [Alkalicoccus luteus]|uniref:C-terminal binding protein n=1 Tax=Alkalicoccus luteus TaxID=1237094 RepID=UPI0040347786
MTQWTIAVTDYDYTTFEPEQSVIDGQNIKLELHQCKTEAEVIEACQHADALLNQYAPITRNVLEQLPNVKVVARYGIGVNTIDVEAATDRNVLVCNVTDYCLDEVADHTMAFVLEHARKLVTLRDSVRKGEWHFQKAAPIPRLRKQTLGLAGFGNIPRNVAEKAKPFGLRVLAYDPFVDEATAAEAGVKLVSFETLCRESDFLSVHLPQTNETEGMFNKEAFQQMKENALIINTSRGPVIDEQALIDALKQGEIGAASLDVLEQEPAAADHPFRTMDNVILTPHSAFYSEESVHELKQKTAQNAVDVLQGRFPAYIVNRDVKEKLALAERS